MTLLQIALLVVGVLALVGIGWVAMAVYASITFGKNERAEKP